MKRLSPIFAILLSMSLGACKGGDSKPAKPTPSKATATPTEKPAEALKEAETPTTDAPPATEPTGALLDPSMANEDAPAKFAVEFTTTKGNFIVDVDSSWSPLGAKRFYNLVKIGYFEELAFFRVINGFMAQFGLHGSAKVNAAWADAKIDDDPVKESNKRGMLSFATAGPKTRTTQLFINFGNNARLDGMGFSPFAKVRDMAVVDKIFSGYGEGAPSGRGPSQARITREGNAYLKKDFPELDYIKSAQIIEAGK